MDTAHDFTVRLQYLLRREHGAMAEFLVALADFDRRRLWMDLGHASLFDFLRRELGLSKASASFRKKAAELIQRFPDLAEPLRDGRLCLSSVFEVGKVLTPENRETVLPQFFQLGKREAKAVAAALRPAGVPAVREMVTAVRAERPATDARPAAGVVRAYEATPAPASRAVVWPAKPSDAGAPASAAASPEGSGAAPRPGDTVGPGAGDAPGAPLADAARAAAGVGRSSPLSGAVPLVNPAAPTSTAVPLTAHLSRLHVTVSRDFMRKLEAARAALSHTQPGAGMEQILEAGLDLLLQRHARRRGLGTTRRRTPRPSKSDHIPAHVLAAVWARDGGRCQWPLASGGICGSTHRVEIDHRVPRALGGPPTVANLRCLCRRHNLAAARQAFGDRWMDRYARNPRAAPAGAAAAPATRSKPRPEGARRGTSALRDEEPEAPPASAPARNGRAPPRT